MDRRWFTVIRPIRKLRLMIRLHLLCYSTLGTMPPTSFSGRSTLTPTKHNFSGDQSLSVMAMLYPMSELDAKGNKAGLMTKLSFSAPAVAPEEGKGEEWLVLSECVTYLLYPFITCGATDGWDTGISVSNTTADGNIFGAFDATTEQNGAVVMYGFPKKLTAEAPMVDPIVQTVAATLMAGDTITFQCSNTTMAGMEGYAIIKASFQHARGMAFVVGDFADGASADVAHGYVAEVINDPGTRSDKIGRRVVDILLSHLQGRGFRAPAFFLSSFPRQDRCDCKYEHRIAGRQAALRQAGKAAPQSDRLTNKADLAKA